MDSLDVGSGSFLVWLEVENMHCLPEGDTLLLRLKKGWSAFRNQSPVQLFTWLVILIIFVFYCIPKSKRSVYLLPIYPFMAVLIAEYLLALVQRGHEFQDLCNHLCFFGLVAYACFVVVRLGLVPDSVLEVDAMPLRM